VLGISPGHKGSWCVGLTTLLHLCGDTSKSWVPESSGTLWPIQASTGIPFKPQNVLKLEMRILYCSYISSLPLAFMADCGPSATVATQISHICVFLMLFLYESNKSLCQGAVAMHEVVLSDEVSDLS
jgi:hypothetical protein